MSTTENQEAEREARRAQLRADLDETTKLAKRVVSELFALYATQPLEWQAHLATFLRVAAEAKGNSLTKKIVKADRKQAKANGTTTRHAG